MSLGKMYPPVPYQGTLQILETKFKMYVPGEALVNVRKVRETE